MLFGFECFLSAITRQLFELCRGSLIEVCAYACIAVMFTAVIQIKRKLAAAYTFYCPRFIAI